MMRVLVLSFYFHPDLSAGSFRATALVEALREGLPEGSSIDVLSTMPNRYCSYSAEAAECQTVGNVTIRRVAMPPHRSGIVDQSRAFLTFARFVSAHVFRAKYDLIIATSSRLMTACLGSCAARGSGADLVLDIRDIFPDTLKDIRPAWLFRPASWLFSLMERLALRRAFAVNLVSRGFEPYFTSRYPSQTFFFHPNGIDEEFMADHSGDHARVDGLPIRVLYAGNIGEGQGLERILPKLAKATAGRAKFTVIGDGGRCAQLRRALEDEAATNVELLDPVGRSDLVRAYAQADVLFLHLNDYDAFQKVLPSKIFEYAATGKPIWAGVAGYAARFIETELEGATVFPPGNVQAAVESFDQLSLRTTPRTGFVQRYGRRSIMRDLVQDILSRQAMAGRARGRRSG